MIIALDDPHVSQTLEYLVQAPPADRDLTTELVMPYVNKVVARVLSRHGFEASAAGVVAFGRAIEPHTHTDSFVRQLLTLLEGRVFPTSVDQLHEEGSAVEEAKIRCAITPYR